MPPASTFAPVWGQKLLLVARDVHHDTASLGERGGGEVADFAICFLLQSLCNGGLADSPTACRCFHTGWLCVASYAARIV